MNKSIIALRGKGNIGKSTTLRLSYDLLLEQSGAVSHSFELLGRSKDFMAVVLLGAVKVGFYSQGDVAGPLKVKLKELISRGCSVIVCTTRTRGATVEVVRSFDPPYGITWLEQQESPPQQRNQSNPAMAKVIVKTIRSAIGA